MAQCFFATCSIWLRYEYEQHADGSVERQSLSQDYDAEDDSCERFESPEYGSLCASYGIYSL